MNKEKKTDDNKKSKKHKLIKITIVVLIVVITLGIASFVVLHILITDHDKNPYKYNAIRNEEIINKEFVNSLSLMNNSFTFKLTEEDVNEMLTNSLKTDLVSTHVESAYLQIEETNFKWCFDLDVPVFDTRLVINTHIQEVQNMHLFVIDSMNIGKLNAWSMLQSKGYISDGMLNNLFKNADLPIESYLENGYFLYSPLNFVEKFNVGCVTSELFKQVSSLDRLSVDNNYFGFKLNLDGVVFTSFTELVGTYDLPNELETVLNEEAYTSLTVGEETSVLEVSDDDFSKWIKDCYSQELEIEKIESGLVNTRVIAKIKKVEASFSNNELTLSWVIKLGNGYFKVSKSIGGGSSASGFQLVFPNVVNGNEFQNTLMEDFLSKIIETGYASFTEGNNSLTFDFRNVNMASSIESFAFKRVNIEDNKFKFYIKKIV